MLEYLSGIRGKLPQGAEAALGPDATGLGWIYQYVVEDTTGTHSLAELRSIQDWYLRYQLTSVPGVSEVASVGGFADLDPLPAHRQRVHAAALRGHRPLHAHHATGHRGEQGDFAGITNSWTMPIKGRIDMLATGIRTPVGIKIFGADLAELERIGREVEGAINMVPGTRSVFAERAVSGYYRTWTSTARPPPATASTWRTSRWCRPPPWAA